MLILLLCVRVWNLAAVLLLRWSGHSDTVYASPELFRSLFVLEYKVGWLCSRSDLDAEWDGSKDVTAMCSNLLYL